MRTSLAAPEHAWRALDGELAHWLEAGHAVRLWWRDDDARTVTPELRRLLDLADAFTAPLLLSVVPGPQAVELGSITAARPIFIAQHGVDHHNRRLVGLPSQFPVHELPGRMALELRDVGLMLEDLPGALPVYVPPWNTVTPGLMPALRLAGFRGVSAFGRDRREHAGLQRVDVHLDVLEWAPHARFRGVGHCVMRLVHCLHRRRRRQAWTQPVGILTHHLALDPGAWDFMGDLLMRLAQSGAAEWPSPDTLFSAQDRQSRALSTRLGGS